MNINWLIATLIVVTAAVLIFCLQPNFTRVHDVQEDRLAAFVELRQFLCEAQDSLIESPTTNATDFIQWTKSYSLSTNRTAVKLRSMFDAFWVNKDFDAWRDSVKERRFLLVTAVMGHWQLHGTNGFIGVNFKGEPVDERGLDSNFIKLDLPAAKSGP